MEAINYQELLVKMPAILLFFLALFYIFKDPITEKIKEYRKAKKVESLVSHDVFLTIDKVVIMVEGLDFLTNGEFDENKTALLKVLIDKKLNTVKSMFKLFLLDPKMNSCTGQELKAETINTLTNIVKTYTADALDEMMRKGISREDAKFLINAYENFRREIVDAFLDRVESIASNENYGSNYDKLSAIMEVIAISLYIIPKDAKSALDAVNGRFKNYNLK
ncbi:hypothetical protein [Flavobacterium psychrophilum]|uniref:Uncharacterized protein n=1 Tax=Flavobacterium psychrophilum TaxID=96345 RepID=A0A7U2NE98_FLAPS|nr:hypothetical protein [Flavobacterium psychrophilum]EKT3962776.1 hypothetical protein [Flavobacterium psychrophilum]QRE03502.1 hypothetical protein H0H26_11515 [Flavobacterium psychrophilum]